MNLNFTILLFGMTMFIASCGSGSSEEADTLQSAKSDSAATQDLLADLDYSPAEDLVDERDGRVYKTIRIGDQIWMAENLKYDAGEGSFCFDDKEENCEKQGRLYTWLTAMNGDTVEGSQGICPKGWHLPSNKDWDILIETVGGENAGKLFKSDGALGFNGDLIGGRMALEDGGYKYIKNGTDVCFWSSESDSTGAFDRNLSNRDDLISKRHYPKTYGFCVRCIKD